MIEIIVSRAPGDKQGPDITGPLITVPQVAVAKGTTEIDRECSDRLSVSVQAGVVPWLNPGGLVGVTTAKGRRVGRLTRFAKEYLVSGNSFTATSTMDVEVVDVR